ncbi:hypothetical protein ACWEV3_34635 [Saccharopolyspora sp. NPDC003752]
MERRPGETRHQQLERLSRSCYHCGVEIRDRQELNEHEDAHTCARPALEGASSSRGCSGSP